MVRIVFQLDKNLAKAFDQYSQKQDCAKAALIREWVNNLELVRFFKKDHTAETITYHFRLEDEIVRKLDQRAKSLSVSRSALLRNLIKTGLLESKSKPWITDTYLMEKTYPQIAQLLSSYPGEPSIELLMLEARANMEIGPIDVPHIRKVLQQIKVMSRRETGNYRIFAEMKLLEGELLAMQGNFSGTLQLFNEAKMIAYANADYVFLSDIYYTLALVQHIMRDIDGAIHTYENALEYITVQDNPLRIARIYVHLAMMYMADRNFKSAARYLARSKKFFSPQKTPHYIVIYQSIYGLFQNVQGHFEEAISELTQALASFKEMQSFFGMYIVAQGLAKAYFLSNQLSQARAIFNSLEMQENVLAQPFSQSNSPLFLSYMNIQQNHELAVRNIEKFIDIKAPYSKIEVEEYILACGLYIYGKTEEETLRGRKILQELTKKGSTELLQNAAKETLKNKKMYPVTVI